MTAIQSFGNLAASGMAGASSLATTLAASIHPTAMGLAENRLHG